MNSVGWVVQHQGCSVGTRRQDLVHLVQLLVTQSISSSTVSIGWSHTHLQFLSQWPVLADVRSAPGEEQQYLLPGVRKRRMGVWWYLEGAVWGIYAQQNQRFWRLSRLPSPLLGCECGAKVVVEMYAIDNVR